MGDAVPQTPWDLSLSFSRMDVFPFTANGTCRTIERLDRRVGQRRDATRAPIQARNGWRPHGRRLGQPATPSKDARNFVQTMGSTSLAHHYIAILMTRIHLKRMASDHLALCGIRPLESFKLIETVPKFTPLETDSVCKTCLRAALGLTVATVQD